MNQNLKHVSLPVHSLELNSLHINILPLDHNNPYDFKREHRHTYFEIMLIERGGGNQTIDFINYEVNDCSCYIIFPQQVHLMNRKNSTGTIIQFTEDRINSADLSASLKQLSFYENAAIIFENSSDVLIDLRLLLELLHSQIYKANSKSNQAISHLLQAFVSLVLVSRTQNEISVLALDKKLLIDFYQLLEMHFKENLGVQHFIEKLGTTEKKLAAATKKYAGLSPLQVIHNRLLLEAKRILLFEETSHKEIAYQLGFDSPASFSAFIKSKTGYAPSELTKHLAEIHK